MDATELKKRTKHFALDIIALVTLLPKNQVCEVIGRQLLRSGTSVGANYRSACRSKSVADFVNKLSICEEEADECGYWLELLAESGQVADDTIAHMLGEASELTAIMVSSKMTARRRLLK